MDRDKERETERQSNSTAQRRQGPPAVALDPREKRADGNEAGAVSVGTDVGIGGFGAT